MQNFTIYNTISRKKEEFKALNPPHVGLYVCGPTVYGETHLGHARAAVTFDLLFRYLKYLKYKVRYVRNITDVGHLENDADEGEDKIAKKARLEQVEPMEIVQHYVNQYHDHMHRLNVLSPSIEPFASGHVIEQQLMVKKIIDKGYAYLAGGSVYFDVEKYNSKYNYGKLSGRKTEDLLANTRKLEGQDEKKNPFDFAIWKKADEKHIMRWPSEWGDGFPGWHLECSTMSEKYLGEKFDIHGGGMDLLFPHHECEIAQTVAATGKESVNYWMHNNMITINGQKMGRSLGNSITLDQLFTEGHELLEQTYTPQTIRFFMLQAHYRSTLDFSNDALKASEKGLDRLMEAMSTLENITPQQNEPTGDIPKPEIQQHSTKNSDDRGVIDAIINNAFEAMNDDLNSPIALSYLFEAVKIINLAKGGKESLSESELVKLKEFFSVFIYEILGLKKEGDDNAQKGLNKKLIDTILQIRQEAKARKDFATSDHIRDELTKLGIVIKDTKDGAEWKIVVSG
jgi:cysteinyl-tRNA synthetase